MLQEDLILSMGDMELKITKKGKVQVRTKKGTASIESGFKVQHGKETIQLASAFTTTSGVFVDVTGLQLSEEHERKLNKLLDWLKKKGLKFPYELESFEVGFPSGIKGKFKKKTEEN